MADIFLPANYSEARRYLQQCASKDELKDYRDKAAAMKSYAFQSRNGELAAWCVEIQDRATLRIGELMAADRSSGKLKKGRPKKLVSEKLISLAEQGVDQNLANRARKAAAMSKAEFEKNLAKKKTYARAIAEGERALTASIKADKHKEAIAKRTKRERQLAEKIRALPAKKYGVIYADPEWKFKTYSPKGKTATSAEAHYLTSDLEAIKARNVGSIAFKDSVLFLWCTVPMQPEGYEVMAAWGFKYVSQIAWVKDHAGTGYWTRNRHEVLLIGKRGAIPAPAMGKQPESVVFAKVGKHSEKPKIFYEIIEKMFPMLPKIELNARTTREGWDSWGTLEGDGK